jgi:hypothetical protein
LAAAIPELAKGFNSNGTAKDSRARLSFYFQPQLKSCDDVYYQT